MEFLGGNLIDCSGITAPPTGTPPLHAFYYLSEGYCLHPFSSGDFVHLQSTLTVHQQVRCLVDYRGGGEGKGREGNTMVMITRDEVHYTTSHEVVPKSE